MPTQNNSTTPAKSENPKDAAQEKIKEKTGTDDKGILDKAKESVSNAMQSGKDMFNEIGDSISSGIKYLEEQVLKDSQSVGGAYIEEIGKPFKFADTVDPQNRTYQFLTSKMSMVDIYPCNYAQSYMYNSGQKKSMFKYGIGYQVAMQQYQKMVKNYLGEGGKIPSGVRLFLTEDATTTDGISNDYKLNWFQEKADKLSDGMSTFTSMISSLSSHAMNKGVEQLIGDINVDNIMEEATQGLGVSDGTKDILGNIIEGMKQSAAIILKGNKISLPKIWDKGSYTTSFTLTTKLFTPYGSPDAVAQHIVRPLALLLMLAIPQSNDMISYGKPFACSVHYWGNGKLKLAGIKSISIQRGGSDAAYNIFRQPLVVNVSIEFGSLVEGVMAFNTYDDSIPVPQYEKTRFSHVSQYGNLGQTMNVDLSGIPTVIPTLGDIIFSFEPVKHHEIPSAVVFNGESIRNEGLIGGGSVMGNGAGGGYNGLAGGIIGDTVNKITGGVDTAVSKINSGIDSVSASIGSAIRPVTEVASSIFGFANQTLNGATTVINSVTGGVNNIVSKLNGVIQPVIGVGSNSIASILGGPEYKNTALGNAVSSFTTNILKQQTQMNQAANAVKTLNGSLSQMTNMFGNLLNSPVGK